MSIAARRIAIVVGLTFILTAGTTTTNDNVIGVVTVAIGIVVALAVYGHEATVKYYDERRRRIIAGELLASR